MNKNIDANEKLAVKLQGFRGGMSVTLSESALNKLAIRSEKPESADYLWSVLMGATLELKREALEKVKYQFLLQLK